VDDFFTFEAAKPAPWLRSWLAISLKTQEIENMALIQISPAGKKVL
jgi:hypothetical protein